MTTRAWIAAYTAVGLLSASPLGAQEVASCQTEETVQQCYERHRPVGGVPADVSGPEAQRAEAVRDVARELVAKPTGTDLSTAGPLTAIRDYLPRLAAALLTPVADDNAQSLGAKINLPLNNGVLFDWGLTAQLAAVVNDPQPFSQLVDSIPASLREASRERLQAGLEPYDDLNLTGSLNLENKTFGRGMRQHHGDIDRVVREVLEPDADEITAINLANQEYLTFRTQLDQQFQERRGLDGAQAGKPECVLNGPGGPPDAGQAPIRCFDAATRDRIRASIGRIAVAAAREVRGNEERVRASGILRLSQLMNNQPQLNADWEYRIRADVVGPDQWTAKARFELGFANMNGLRRHCGTAGLRESCLRSYVEIPAVRRSLARGDRVWLQADFTRRNPWQVNLPKDSVELSLRTTTTFALSGGYGAYLGADADGQDRDRLDLQGKYDFTHNDVLRQNRLVATIFYTRRLSDQSSALIGVTYANRPEFVGDVDRHLSANLGLTYKLNNPPSVAGGDTTP